MSNKNIIKQIQDVNGKTFDLDLSKIQDINGDIGNGVSASISDSQKNRVHQIHDTEFYDSNGKVIDAEQLIKDMSSGKEKIIALDVEMEATHSGKNHNYCIYYEDSMEADAESFVNPFKKPVLKNHDSYGGEPMGRILQAWTGPSVLTDERSAIHLKTRITDQEAIPKFLDGRYGTVSISGTMGTVTCNICGKNILKDGKFKFCGHWKGETYKDEICYWGARDIEYHEVSTVNNPADDYAQIMKVTVITDSNDSNDNKDNNDNKEESNMHGKNGKTSADDNKANSAKTAICDMIDELLGNKATDNQETLDIDAIIKDNITEPEPAADDTAKDSKDPEASEELESLKVQLADAKTQAETLEAELKTATDSLEEKVNELQDVQTEALALKDKCLALAVMNKELVADGIIKSELVSGDIKEDVVDARKEELVGMSMKDLNALAAKTTDAAPQRQPAQIKNPTLAVEDNQTSNGSADTHKTTDSNKTVNCYVDDIVNKLVK